jgi:hypothetical protein
MSEEKDYFERKETIYKSENDKVKARVAIEYTFFPRDGLIVVDYVIYLKYKKSGKKDKYIYEDIDDVNTKLRLLGLPECDINS